jgi:hypothetical protein
VARIEFTSEAKKATTNYDYPKLKLKNGERARILLLEAPVVEYVHTLRAPQLINGLAVMETKKRRDDSEYQDHKMDFLSRPICLGDEGILDDKGSDAKNCPMCALAKENSDMSQAPQRRFAMHVIRYKTKPNGFEPITPFSVELLVWSFTDKVFNKIVDFKNEFGDLRKHDLTLGPCTNEGFQQYDISISAKGAWLEDDARKSLTAETFKNNQIPDLSIACGAKKELKWIEEDLSKIRTNWGIATGLGSAPLDETSSVGSLSDGLGDLMNTKTTTDEPWVATPYEETAKTAGDLDDLLGGVAAVKAAPEAAPAPVETSTDDDLLGGLLDDEPEEQAPAPKAKAASKAKAAPAPEAPAASGAGDIDDLLADLI